MGAAWGHVAVLSRRRADAAAAGSRPAACHTAGGGAAPAAPGARGVPAERPALPAGAAEAAGRPCIGGPGRAAPRRRGWREAPVRREQASCREEPQRRSPRPSAASEARRVSTCARLSLAAHSVTSRRPPLPPAPRVAPAPRARGSLSAVASSLDVPRCSPPAPSSAHAQGTWEATALGPCVLRPGPCALFSAGRSGREAFFPSVFPAVETLSSSTGRREPCSASTGRSRLCQAHHRARHLACKSEGKRADVDPTQTEEGP